MKIVKYVLLTALALLGVFFLIGYFGSPGESRKSAQLQELEKICSQSLADAYPHQRQGIREACELTKKKIQEGSGLTECEDLLLQKKRALKLDNKEGAKMYEDEYKAKCK